MLDRTIRSWRSWAAPAAGLWSCLVTVVGVLWSTDILGSPFGITDPRAGEVGSYLDGLESSQVGLVAIAVGLAGTLTALAVRQLPGSRWPAIPALCLSFALILVVPDVRVIQNFAYLFFGYTGLWDSALAAMLVSMLGGLLWILTAFAQLARGRSLPASLREPRWTTLMTYAAAFALPYPVIRIAWALGLREVSWDNWEKGYQGCSSFPGASHSPRRSTPTRRADPGPRINVKPIQRRPGSPVG